jgi:hypothetical protein
MYMEPKGIGTHVDNLPARIGRVSFSKSGKTLRYRDQQFSRSRGVCGNYVDDATGESYWISGCKADGNDRLFPGVVRIDDDVREEYWLVIRKRPACRTEPSFRCAGKHGGKRPSRL